jgi:UV DNA damage endonuclease
MKSCTIKNANEENLHKIISHNLNSLDNTIEYNIKNNIKLFRISSDLIPFGSNQVNKLPWGEIFKSEFFSMGKKILDSGMRVSMHPGQYTVLNSIDEGVVKRAIEDLNYHSLLLDSLGVGFEHKIVLHIGGVYNDKKAAVQRFLTNYQYLNQSVKQRLVLENDDKSYNICDLLDIGTQLNKPVIYDNLHNEINSCNKEKSDLYWINECMKTWHEKDGRQKIHYSQQDYKKSRGAHSNTIKLNEFMRFYNNLELKDIDIMLEVKDKNLSAVKCINATCKNGEIKLLEREWSKYKYLVLEKSHSDYIAIRKLLQNKNDYPVIAFYSFIENALEKENDMGGSINAALHVWSYFKDIATKKEKDSFFNKFDLYKQGNISIKVLKSFLWKLTLKYEQTYLLESYYFLF